MTDEEKCVAVIKNIVERCNAAEFDDAGRPTIGFSPDWGGNSLTIHVENDHTHVGSPDATFSHFVDRLYARLILGEGRRSVA